MPNRKVNSRSVGNPPSLHAIRRKLRTIDEKLNDILLFTRQQQDSRLRAEQQERGIGFPSYPSETAEQPPQAGGGQPQQSPMYPGWGTLPPEVTNNPFFDPFAPPLVPFHPPMNQPAQQATGATDQAGGGLTEVKDTRVVGRGKRSKGVKKHRT